MFTQRWFVSSGPFSAGRFRSHSRFILISIGAISKPLDTVEAMLNMDMVGRLKDNKLMVMGSGTLRQTYQANIRVFDDYTVWTALVQETMLGGLSEDQRRDEFALQAAYVVFIRLLLIRVCEDKELFQSEDRVVHRFVSDGGMKQWQETIKRYWIFATGNPYSPLLDMAYNNAQNIYAHFFTGRELFNWYQLNEQQLIMTLHQLSRFNFAGVDSDIVGTVYNTYVSRKEKKEKGQPAGIRLPALARWALLPS